MDQRETVSRDGRFRFGVFEFDARALELWKNGRLVPVRPQPLKLLALLLARPGDLVSREEIERALWSEDTFVDFEQGVNHAIRELRAALGDAAESPRFIQTLPRRGYRFLGPVDAIDATEQAPAVSSEATIPVAVANVPVGPRSSRRWMWIATVGSAAVAVVIAVQMLASRWTTPADPTPLVLWVRPFSAPADDAITGVGLAQAISARLGGQQVLTVHTGDPEPLSTDVASASGGPSDSDGTALVLSGEIARSGDDVSVVTRLDRLHGDTLWTENFRVEARQLFDVESVIADRVAERLRLRLAGAEQERLRRRHTTDGVAYDDYLRGRAALVAYTPDGTRTAVRAFEGALARDPAYAVARAGLAMAAADMYLRFAPPAEVEAWGARAETEARAALDLDADLAEAHLARAAVARKREFDWKATIESSRRALLLNPSLAQGHLFTAAAYYHLGYMDEARIALDRARSLRGPDVVEPLRIDALIALFSGEFAPARARLEEVSRLSSQAIGDTYLALAYYYSGSADRSRRMLESLAAASSASTSARAGVTLAGVLAAQGDVAGARAQITRVAELEYRDHHVAYGFGAAYAQLGDTNDAIGWLRIAADTGFPCLPFFERDPLLEPLRRRPEYADLVAYVRDRRDAALANVSR
jgi:DNA-binding winged helix-turn-helix (wHTH) protein/tetratricopeptide (TPR) repeat protein